MCAYIYICKYIRSSKSTFHSIQYAKSRHARRRKKVLALSLCLRTTAENTVRAESSPNRIYGEITAASDFSQSSHFLVVGSTIMMRVRHSSLLLSLSNIFIHISHTHAHKHIYLYIHTHPKWCTCTAPVYLRSARKRWRPSKL